MIYLTSMNIFLSQGTVRKKGSKNAHNPSAQRGKSPQPPPSDLGIMGKKAPA